MLQGAAVQDHLRQTEDEELYAGLHLPKDESDWVKHYLRLADHVLFERRPTPRVVVIDEEWSAEPTPKKQPRISKGEAA